MKNTTLLDALRRDFPDVADRLPRGSEAPEWWFRRHFDHNSLPAIYACLRAVERDGWAFWVRGVK